MDGLTYLGLLDLRSHGLVALDGRDGSGNHIGQISI